MPEPTSIAEPSAAKDSYLGKSFTEFAARVNPAPEKTESNETKPEKDAEPGAAATSEKTKPEEKSKTAAEPGAAPKQEPSKEDKDKPTADERIAQLTRELKELKAAPAKTEPIKAEPAKEPPKRPNPFKWTGTPEEFDKAMDEYDAYQRQQAVADHQRQTAERATQTEVAGKLEQARKKYADADTKIFPTLEAIATAPIPNAVIAMVNSSEVMVDLLYTLGEPAKLKEFLHTARTDPGKAIREVVVLENLIREELAKGATKDDVKPEVKAEAEPPARPEPRAPEPAKDVAGRGTTPTDELDDAVRNNDYLRAKREQERRYFAASK